MKLAIVLTDQAVMWGGKDQPMDLYQKIDLLPTSAVGFETLAKEIKRYPKAEIHLFFHLSQVQYKLFPLVEKLKSWERKKALTFQMADFIKDKIFWGYVENKEGPSVGYGLPALPVVHDLVVFLKTIPNPLAGVYPLTLAICKRAYEQLVQQTPHLGEWNIIFVNMEHTLPVLVLMAGVCPVVVRVIQEGELVEKAINVLFQQAKSQTTAIPAFVVYGSSPKLSEGLPWHAYMAFPPQASPFKVTEPFLQMRTPLDRQRNQWRMKQLSQMMSFILIFLIGLFYGVSYFLEANLRSKKSYFQAYTTPPHEVHLPQGFYAQKAVVMLEDRLQKFPWMETWTHLSGVALPPFHQVVFQGSEGQWVVQVKVEAQEEVEPLLEALKAALETSSATVTQLPDFMDEQRSFSTNLTEGEPALMTLTLTKEMS